MTCTEFQEFVPDGPAREPTEEEQTHLNSCRNCINLLLDQVVASAKFLLSLEEPPPRVWDKIRHRLEGWAAEPASHQAD
jgi:hypothetical protein